MGRMANEKKRENKAQISNKRRKIQIRKEKGEKIKYKEDFEAFCLKKARGRKSFKKHLRRSPVKTLREFFQEHHPDADKKKIKKMSKDEVCEGLLDKYYGITPSFIRREEEEKNLQTLQTSELFFKLCGIEIPLDVIKLILNFMKFNSKMLFSLGRVSQNWYLAILFTWNSYVKINSSRVLKMISLIVMKNMSKVQLGNKITTSQIDYLCEKWTPGNIKYIKLSYMTVREFGVFIRRLNKNKVMLSNCVFLEFPRRLFNESTKKNSKEYALIAKMAPNVVTFQNPPCCNEGNWKGLKRLRSIISFGRMANRFLKNFNLENLRSLKLSECPSVESLKKLKKLEFLQCDFVGSQTQRMKHLPMSLQHVILGFRSSYSLNQITIPIFVNVKNATLRDISPGEVLDVLKKWECLEKLTITFSLRSIIEKSEDFEVYFGAVFGVPSFKLKTITTIFKVGTEENSYSRNVTSTIEYNTFEKNVVILLEKGFSNLWFTNSDLLLKVKIDDKIKSLLEILKERMESINRIVIISDLFKGKHKKSVILHFLKKGLEEYFEDVIEWNVGEIKKEVPWETVVFSKTRKIC